MEPSRFSAHGGPGYGPELLSRKNFELTTENAENAEERASPCICICSAFSAFSVVHILFPQTPCLPAGLECSVFSVALWFTSFLRARQARGAISTQTSS